MKILIACEISGIVRNAFLDRGHDVWSCDILDSMDKSNRHIRDDARNVLKMEQWDMLVVAHPPCTRLCNSGVRWLSNPPPDRNLADMWAELDEGAAFFSEMWNADVPRIAVENPIMHRHAKERIRGYRQFDQSVHPWHFATDENGPDNVKKRTCLWLRGLPKLTPTGTLDGTTARDDIHKASPGPDRAKRRSTFFPGLASAFADQWGGHATDFPTLTAYQCAGNQPAANNQLQLI